VYAFLTTHKRLEALNKRIDRIKAELTAIKEMRPGSLTRQHKDPKSQNGAYYQLSYTWEPQLSSPIDLDDVPSLKFRSLERHKP